MIYIYSFALLKVSTAFMNNKGNLDPQSKKHSIMSVREPNTKNQHTKIGLYYLNDSEKQIKN